MFLRNFKVTVFEKETGIIPTDIMYYLLQVEGNLCMYMYMYIFR